MKFRNVKNEEVVARLDSVDEKYGTVILVYETGENAGKSINITKATLKRWWKEMNEERTEEEILNLDMDAMNEPYPEPKKQEYIPKPESVIQYEKKKRGKKLNEDIPTFEKIVEILGDVCSKVNETSSYVKLNDKATTIWRKTTVIDIYAGTDTAEKLANKGLVSSPNKDKVRPFAFSIKCNEDFEKVVSAIKGD